MFGKALPLAGLLFSLLLSSGVDGGKRNLRRLEVPNSKDFNFLIREILAFEVDTDPYWAIKKQIGDIMEFGFLSFNDTNNDIRGRHLQDAENFVHDGSAGDFDHPCMPLPSNPTAEGWQRLNVEDDEGAGVTLAFDFTLYGVTYTAGTEIYINNNGHITFGFKYPEFFVTGFPLGDRVPMIAPFFTDIDTRHRGNVWYKMESDQLSVIWDRVPRYNDTGVADDVLNTFQAVIGRDTDIFDSRGNICFCYTDMDWTTGRSSGGVNGFGGCPATVGLNAGNFFDFVQLGRFSLPGEIWDGGAGGEDGVDYLDGRNLGDSAICLDGKTSNVPPVFIDFPSETISVPCLGKLSFVFSISSPELDETVSVTTPDMPDGATLTVARNDGTTVIYKVEWRLNKFQSGLYEFPFVATDSNGGTTTRTFTVDAASCPDTERCVEVPNDSTCNPFNPRPFCTPFRSLEFCPEDESFPTQISTRSDAVADDPQSIDDDGYWFYKLDDKVGGYIFSSTQNVNAAKLYCCVDDIDDLLPTCFPANSTLDSFVIRANGHSGGRGIFAFPNGFGGLELLRQINMQANDVIADLKTLDPEPDKIVVEEFLPGETSNSLPVEYKFHMFDGEIGSVSAIYNRAGTCACYAEFDEDFNRLDQFGCFEPGQPYGIPDRNCYAVDFEAGSTQLFQVKELDICSDPLPSIPSCVWNDMKSTAERLSREIGVYMRIDFFVSNNIAYVQEYSSNHNNGKSHCAAREDPVSRCVDTCFLGEMWKEISAPPGNALYGGRQTGEPIELDDFRTLSAQQQCNAASGLNPNDPPQTSC